MEKTENLVRRFQRSSDQHERDAIFREIYARYIRLVEFAIKKIDTILSEDRTDDVVQETMIIIARQLDVFVWDTEKKFNAWIYGIAANKAREESRKSRKEESLFDKEVIEEPMSNDSNVNAEEALTKLFEIWKGFDPEGFEINYLFHTEGKRDKDIADMLGISTEAARQRRIRAAKNFKDYLMERFGVSTVDEWIENFPTLKFTP